MICYFSITHNSHHCDKNDFEIWATKLNTETTNLVTFSFYMQNWEDVSTFINILKILWNVSVYKLWWQIEISYIYHRKCSLNINKN
jgi:hypothetical protein